MKTRKRIRIFEALYQIEERKIIRGVKQFHKNEPFFHLVAITYISMQTVHSWIYTCTVIPAPIMIVLMNKN